MSAVRASPSVTPAPKTPEGAVAIDVMLATFRLNGVLLAAGDVMTADENLTSARWQVLGAIALARRPLTVPQIARRMGLTRQSVHATVKHLLADGHVELSANSDHRRSQLVKLTGLGVAKFNAMDERSSVWANRIAEGLDRDELETTLRVLDEMCTRIDLERSGVREA
jgi:DNA-binding MarR family transcriptional regulator